MKRGTEWNERNGEKGIESGKKQEKKNGIERETVSGKNEVGETEGKMSDSK